ncbi:MAG: MFS transporter [Acutalibacteraceae bacterium]|nr:MFS transporter [Acutalibacteraceae bacterium]
MTTPNFKKTRFACYFAYLAISAVFVLPPMLFVTFHNMYNISYTLLGTLVLVNFCTQLTIDLIFTFLSKYFNIKLTIRIMPLITSVGMLCYAVLPNVFPQSAYLGLVLGTIIFSVSAGLAEVLISPLVAAMPSDNPEKDMSMLHSLYGWGVVTNVIVASVFFLIFGTENWMYLTLFLAVMPLIASFLFFTSPFPKMDVSSGEKSGVKWGKAIILCAMCIFLGSAAENTMTNWISSFMENALQLPKALGDILGLAVFALLLAITRGVYAKFTPNITKTLLAGMIGAAVCYVVIGVSGNVILSFIACILVGIFSSMLWPGTLILMEEKVPNPGVAAFALMAASGDFGASIAPQMLGIIVDKVSASSFATNLSQATSMATDEIGLKVGMLLASVFPILGIGLLIYIMKTLKAKKD